MVRTLAERMQPKPTRLHPWIGVDFDGTLAISEPGTRLRPVDLKAVPLMASRVIEWLAIGYDVRLFTARFTNPLPNEIAELRHWCLVWLGREIPITATKDGDMVVLFDDRAVQVERNTGRIIGDFTDENLSF